MGVNEMIAGVKAVIAWEKELEAAAAAPAADAAPAPGAPAPGIEYKFPSGAGAAHGNWKDDTCVGPTEAHAPTYYPNGYADFGEDLKKFEGNLIIKDVLTEEMYNKYKDQKTSLGVTIDKCIKGGVDMAKLGADWNTGKVGFMFGDAESADLFKELVHPVMLARHNNPNLPHPPSNLDGSGL